MLATATVVSILFLIYAFVQQTEAHRQKVRAEDQATLAKKNEDRAVLERNKADSLATVAQKETEAAIFERHRADTARQEAVANFTIAENAETASPGTGKISKGKC